MTSERVVVSTVGRKASRAQARGHEVATDFPHDVGGEDGALMPSELMLAALGACLSVTLRTLSEIRKEHVRDVSIVVEGELDRGLFARIRVTMEIDTDLPDEKVSRLLELTEKHCTVSRALGLAVERTWTRRQPPIATPEAAEASSS